MARVLAAVAWLLLGLWLWHSPAAAQAADLELVVRPYPDDNVPRQAYLRREKPVVRLHVVNRRPQTLKGEGRLSLMLGDEVVRTVTWSFRAPPSGEVDVPLPLSLAECRTGVYHLAARCYAGGLSATAEAPLWICPESDEEGLWMSTWWERPANEQASVDMFLEGLHQRGLAGVTVMSASPMLLDRCLWNQIGCSTITHGNAAGAGFNAPAESLYRLNSNNQPWPVPWQPGPQRQVNGIANIDWQLASARNLGSQVATLMRFPAFHPRVLTNDDLSYRAGLDYNPWNLRRYRLMFGDEPARPPELAADPAPRTLNRPPGVVPDDDPWLRWMRFLSRDVLGHYNRLLTGEVLAATGGRGKIGPISGPMFTPLVDMASAQWPPYNFGDAGFNLTASYNYNFYQAPALTQVWWQELGRMGNRDGETWVMPDSLDTRTTYHLQNWHLLMASGVDGLAYFLHEQTSDAAIEALRRVGPIAQRLGKLFTRLKPAPRPIGLLMPFETAAFRIDYPAQAGYAFDNLAMARLEVEPVWPEELPLLRANYRAILLHDVSHLTQSNLKLLAEYRRRGGVVVSDAATSVDVPGARKLAFSFAGHDRQQDYGDLARIAQVREAIEPLAPPWADSADPHLLLRRFQAGGVDYLWVVHLMTHEEDLAHQSKELAANPGVIPPKVEPLADAGLDRREHASVVNVAALDGAAVYDVIAGKRVAATREGGRLRVPVTMNFWQGTLLAFYPAAPDAIALKLLHRADAGKAATIDVSVSAGKQAAQGLLPLEMTVVDPQGVVSREYSTTALASKGQCRFKIDFARNDQAGIWRVTVREATTGLSQTDEIRLRAGL
ncbi:MAG: hypothetical protein NTW19_22270 [Planctomycetota bacterium]|nr:hypothetical protein [Planctomycetota bacterium]